MAVTPPISGFFGLDPQFLGSPAAASGLINPLLFASSFQQVPINFGPFNPGIPPLFGGSGFGGFPTVPFNFFGGQDLIGSPFLGGNIFGGGGALGSLQQLLGAADRVGTQGFGASPFLGGNPFNSGLLGFQAFG